MDKEKAANKLREMLEDNYICDCDNGDQCFKCPSHKDMVESAVALQFAIDYIENH